MQKQHAIRCAKAWMLATLVASPGCFGPAPTPLVLSGTEGAHETTLEVPPSESTTSAGLPEPGSSASGATETGATTVVEVAATTAGASTEDDTSSEMTSSDGTGSDGAALESTSSMDVKPPAECGNGRVEDGEDCDGIDWQGSTCETLGYAPGELECAGCTFDVTGCVPDGMVLVPEGPFDMGSDQQTDEQPVHAVDIDAFYIDVHEVTVDEYTECVEAGPCLPAGLQSDCNFQVPGREDHPINCIDWNDASTYCTWVDEGTKRLPSEAEWEKAARGTDQRTYPWGSSPDPTCARVVMDEGGAGCQSGSSWPVGDMPLGASPYGVMDMAGNVWEWVGDWYAPYDPAIPDNPTGPLVGALRIVRGGGWYHPEPYIFTTTRRHEIEPWFQDQFIGFRCVHSLPEAP